MSIPTPIVYLLDDEPGIVKAVTRLLWTQGFEVQGFTSAASFLQAYSCLLYTSDAADE